MVGVAVAIAGVPHLVAATGDLSAGTTCTKRCTTTTTLAKTSDLTAAAPAGGTQTIPATLTVSWNGTQMSTKDSLAASLDGVAKWACFNGGSNIPSDSNGVKSASQVTVHIVATDKPRRNGNISQSFTMDLTPTAAEAGLSCKGGQVIALYSFRLLDPAAFALIATSDQGSSSVTVQSNLPYCRDGDETACYS